METETLHSEYEKACQLYSAGAYGESLALLDSLTERYPDNPVLLHARVLCLVKQNRLTEAAETCNRLIKLSPTARSVGVRLLADIAVRLADGELEPAGPGDAAAASAPDSLPAEDSFSSEAESVLPEGRDSLPEPLARDAGEQVHEETGDLTGDDHTSIVESAGEDLESSEDELQPIESSLELSDSSSSDDDVPADFVEADAEERGRRRFSGWFVITTAVLAVIVGVFYYFRYQETGTSLPLPAADTVLSSPSLNDEPTISPPPPAELTLSFPDDRVVGRLFVKEETGPEGKSWKYWGTALGLLSVPVDSELRIEIEECHWLDLDALVNTCGTQLQSLTIRNSALTDDMMSAFERLVNLGELELEHTYQLTDAGILHLAALKKLERLTLEGIDLPTPGGFKFLSELTSLKKLNVEQSSFSDLSMPFLSNLGLLEELSLPGSITEGAFGVLTSLPSLHRLSLGGVVCAGSLDFLPDLEFLELLECRDGITAPGLDSVAKMPRLRTFILNVSAPSVGLERLNACGSLEELRIYGVRLDRPFLESVAALHAFRRLDLDLSEVTATPQEITDSFSRMISLKELVLRGRCPNRETLRSLLSSPNISVLTLVGGVATDVALQELNGLTALGTLRLEQGAVSLSAINVLAGVGSLKELYLLDTRVIGADLATISSAIPNIQITTEGSPYQERRVLFPLSPTAARVYEAAHVSLEATDWRLLGLARGTLWIPSGNVLMLMMDSEGSPDLSRIRDLSPDDLNALVLACDALQDNDLSVVSPLTGLESLTLISSRVGDGAVPYVTKLPNLRYLVLSRAAISDASVALIADSMPDLEGLGLSGCRQITDTGAQHITALKKLQFLDLTDTSVSPELVDRIRAALPECRILGDSAPTSEPSKE